MHYIEENPDNFHSINSNITKEERFLQASKTTLNRQHRYCFANNFKCVSNSSYFTMLPVIFISAFDAPLVKAAFVLAAYAVFFCSFCAM